MKFTHYFEALKSLLRKLPRIAAMWRREDEPMVRIRLRRQGAKKQPSYRIVVIDQRKSRNGRYIENIGYYNPRTEPSTEVVKEDRALYWLSVGAQPSDPVRRIFVHTGTWERFQRMRNGEALEDLLHEADANEQALPSQKTSQRFDDSEPRAIPDLVKELIAEPIPDPPPEPEPTPTPVVNEEYLQLDDVDTKQPTDKAPENKGLLYGDLNRPGATELSEGPYPTDPVPDPAFRTSRAREDLREARRNEPAAHERRRQVFTTRNESKDPTTRSFLLNEYNGKCQICCDVFTKHNGKPYFEALYVEKYTTARWLDRSANTLCLCPNHVARFQHGHRVFRPDYRQQVLLYAGSGEHEIRLELCGELVVIRFSERHIIDLKVLVEETAGDAAP